MTLSKNTLEHLLEAESHIRSAVKSAAVNEKPIVVKNLSDILLGLQQLKKMDEIIDMMENRKPDSKGMFGDFFNNEDE